MTTQTSSLTASSYRLAGWSAIASGAIGILAAGCLIAYLVYRNQTLELGMRMQRFHDAGVILQFLLLLPAVFGLHRLAEKAAAGTSRSMLNTGVGAILFTALFLLLAFPKVVADVLYMLPQGVFGVWLIFVCWRLRSILSRGLTWFGMVVGLGLALVGTFPLGYAIFVDTIILQIPAASDEMAANIPITPANMVLHQIIWVGTPMGVLTLPFWTVLLGRRLLRNGIKGQSSHSAGDYTTA